MKNIIILIMLSLFVYSTKLNAQKSLNKHETTGYNLDQFYGYALSARINDMLAMLDTIPEKKLSEAQLVLKQKYYARFRTNTDQFTFNTNDEDVKNILHFYYGYWQKALCRKQDFNAAKLQLQNELCDYIYQKQYQEKGIVKDSVLNNLQHYLSDYLYELKHINSVINFQGTIADVYLWQKESNKYYKVRLAKEKIKAKVIFMEEVLTLGWQDFASFGQMIPGGFVANTGIYCLPKSDRYNGYDLKSERFKVSYLKHESQHYLDVPRFPKLSFADKEYRAKLIELCYAKKTSYELLREFTIDANSSDRNNAHPYADYVLIRDFSKLLFKKDFESDFNKWKEIPTNKIQETALLLLKENTKALLAKGRDVEEYIMK
jgi:hypothetical protein